ncbi:MAG: peptidase S41, partial [Bacteroidales bacterium]|nr:peptidase S41 [Bacteroidales bacterium]
REHELEYSDELIRFQLKALIARNLYEFKSYFQVLTSFDDGFRKAVEVLSDERFFVELVNN